MTARTTRNRATARGHAVGAVQALLALLLLAAGLPALAGQVAAAASSAPFMTLSTTDVEFEPVLERGGRAYATVVLTNTSGDPQVVADYGIMGNVLDEVGEQFSFGPQTDGGFSVRSACARAEVLGQDRVDALIAQNAAVVPPGGRCVLDLSFAPRDAGDHTRWLKLRMFDDPQGEYTVELRGTATSTGITMSPDELRFEGFLGLGDPEVGTTTAPADVTFANTGAVPVTVTGVGVFGDFAVASRTCTNGLVVAPGGSCRVSIRFGPTAPGWRHGGVTIHHDGPHGARGIPLIGRAAPSTSAPAQLLPDVTQIDFGTAATGQRVARQLTLTNTGSYGVAISEVAIRGMVWDEVAQQFDGGPQFDGGFSTGPTTCPPRWELLPAGASCTVEVAFRARDGGTRSRWLTIGGTFGGGSIAIPLTGTAIAPPPAQPGHLALSTSTLDLGGVPVGAARTEVLTVTNDGTAPLTVHSVRLQGSFLDHLAAFQTSGGFSAGTPGDCPDGAVLAPGQSCQVHVRFAPDRPGASARTLTVATNTADGARDVQLTGEGQTGQPGARLSRTSVDFGRVPQTTTATRGILLSSLGTVDLDVSSVTASGPFTVVGEDCTAQQVEPGNVCLIRVAFTAVDRGAAAGQLTVVDNAPGSPRTVTLSAHAVSRAPVLRVGGPYRAVVGRTTVLKATATDPDGDPLTFAWDLDGNGTFEMPGAEPELMPVGPSRDEIVRVRVCDDSATCTTRATVVRIRVAGQVVVWGADRSGLGVGPEAPRLSCAGGTQCLPTPTAVDGLDDVTDVAVGDTAAPPHQGGQRTLALRADGTVWAWSTDAPAPAAIPGLEDVVALSAGRSHSLALTSDGSVWAWGYDAYGVLGRGTTGYYVATPTRVQGIGRAVAVAAGENHSVALLEDGSVWGWGMDQDRQLAGRCFPSICTEPRSLPGLGGPNAVGVVATGKWTVVSSADGRARFVGGLDASSMWRTSPALVDGLAGITALVGGPDDHLLARRIDGTVWGFGADDRSQLTGGCPVAWNVRRCESALQLDVGPARAIAAGRQTSLAIDDDGSAGAWGADGVGQLGTGDPVDERAVPAAVAVSDLQVAVLGTAHGAAVVASQTAPGDTTPPTLTAGLAPAPGDTGWVRGPVTVTLTATDAGSGVESLTWSATGAQPAVATTVAGSSTTVSVGTDGITTLTATARDQAGNVSAVTTVPVRVDAAAPVVSLTAPTGAFTLGQSVPAAFTCTDATSGVATCTGSAAAGAPVDTSVPGTRTFTVVARDVAGGETTATSSYTVSYRMCTGSGQVNGTARAGSVVPIRLSLCNAAGGNVSGPAVRALRLVKGSTIVTPVVDASKKRTGLFSYDVSTKRYSYELDTRGLTSGTWTMVLELAGDPVLHSLPIRLG